MCPLDWGLGHASRMIPVISLFLDCGANVILGGSGRSGQLLKTTFPQLFFLTIPAPVIRYSHSRFTIPALLWQFPRMLASVFTEHRMLAQIIQRYKVDIVISDNRYGLFSRRAYTIFVTHQLSPVMPVLLKWTEYPIYRIIKTIIGRYNECWIPDFADSGDNLTGKLSHRFKLPSNARFIGILSRFTKGSDEKDEHAGYDMVVVLSGPEPQVSIFEKMILVQLYKKSVKTLIINGMRVPSTNTVTSSDITVVSHLREEEFRKVLIQAGEIVCRSGYSGIMDLVALGRSALLVPTPGQSEQQYLAKYLCERKLFDWIKQDKLSTVVFPVKRLPVSTAFSAGVCFNKTDAYRVLQKENHKNCKISDKEP